jgi:hypothetical protein
MDFLTQLANVLAALIPIVLALNGLGLIIKYVPLKVLGFINNRLIPLLNTLVAFLAAFGGTSTAHAGVFGDLGHAMGLGARLALSAFAAILARQTFEAYIRPLAEAAGLKKN